MTNNIARYIWFINFICLIISKYESDQIIPTNIKSNNCIKSLESKVKKKQNLLRIELF